MIAYTERARAPARPPVCVCVYLPVSCQSAFSTKRTHTLATRFYSLLAIEVHTHRLWAHSPAYTHAQRTHTCTRCLCVCMCAACTRMRVPINTRIRVCVCERPNAIEASAKNRYFAASAPHSLSERNYQLVYTAEYAVSRIHSSSSFSPIRNRIESNAIGIYPVILSRQRPSFRSLWLGLCGAAAGDCEAPPPLCLGLATQLCRTLASMFCRANAWGEFRAGELNCCGCCRALGSVGKCERCKWDAVKHSSDGKGNESSRKCGTRHGCTATLTPARMRLYNFSD